MLFGVTAYCFDEWSLACNYFYSMYARVVHGKSKYYLILLSFSLSVFLGLYVSPLFGFSLFLHCSVSLGSSLCLTLSLSTSIFLTLAYLLPPPFPSLYSFPVTESLGGGQLHMGMYGQRSLWWKRHPPNNSQHVSKQEQGVFSLEKAFSFGYGSVLDGVSVGAVSAGHRLPRLAVLQYRFQ